MVVVLFRALVMQQFAPKYLRRTAILVAVALPLLVTVWGSAQSPFGPGGFGQGRMDFMCSNCTATVGSGASHFDPPKIASCPHCGVSFQFPSKDHIIPLLAGELTRSQYKQIREMAGGRGGISSPPVASPSPGASPKPFGIPGPKSMKSWLGISVGIVAIAVAILLGGFLLVVALGLGLLLLHKRR